jgi:hypothetical protein
MTQQSTPETEPTELTGVEGFRAALAEPERWECDWLGDYRWRKLSDVLEQNTGVKYLTQPGRRWRQIPDPKPVDSALPAEMTAEQATEWLSGTGIAVISSVGNLWERGTSLSRDYRYTPLVPLTRGQLAEIERLKEALANSEATVACLVRDWKPLADWAHAQADHSTGETCSSVALGRINELEVRLRDMTTERDDARAARDSAIVSQKAALAALEREQKESAGLIVCNVRQAEAIDDIRIALENLAEWAGKESGG